MLKERQRLFNPVPTKILWFYQRYFRDVHEILKNEIPEIQFFDSFDYEYTITKIEESPEERHLLILDDCLQSPVELELIFTRYVRSFVRSLFRFFVPIRRFAARFSPFYLVFRFLFGRDSNNLGFSILCISQELFSKKTAFSSRTLNINSGFIFVRVVFSKNRFLEFHFRFFSLFLVQITSFLRRPSRIFSRSKIAPFKLSPPPGVTCLKYLA